MSNETSSKTIAKNTLFLFVRMILVMVVTLYTSRVVLQVLGVDDYGIYQSVGGLVSMLAFFSHALGTGSSRFITFALGKGDKAYLEDTFSTTLALHLLLALLVVVVTETIGKFFLLDSLVIPESRTAAAEIVFHLSIITIFFSILQIPFNALIVAHERMDVFAYISIGEVVARLGIAFLIASSPIDNLVYYALLLLVVQIILNFIYVIYCGSQFKESKLCIKFSRSIARELGAFSGWSLFAQGALALNNHGVLILLNMFFSPAVVAARSISLQVNMAANQFVNNFRTAVNPQIIKRHAQGEIRSSQQLLLESTKYSYFLFAFIGFPILFFAKQILELWLVEVPGYTVIFVQLIIVQSLFQVFDTSLYIALYAKGRLRENALISPTILFVQFPIIYFFFKLGFSPVMLSWTNILASFILGFIIKPLLLVKIANYKLSDIILIFKNCFIVTVVALIAPLVAFYLLAGESFINYVLLFLIIESSLLLSIWYIGINKEIREKVVKYGKSFVNRY